MQRVFWAAAMMAVMLAGCGRGAMTEESISYGSLPAPTRDDVVTRITAADRGATVEVRVGTALAVELIGVPTAGYVWAPVEVPPFLVETGTAGGPTSEAQLEPGFTGGTHWEVFYFNVTGPGAGALSFEQRRPWEVDEEPVETFSATIAAVE